jgi:hypothetical protein
VIAVGVIVALAVIAGVLARQPAERAGQLPRLRPANGTLYAATDFGVFFEQSGDKKWTKLGANLPNTATEDLKIQASSGELYVATFGRGTWRIPLVPRGSAEQTKDEVPGYGRGPRP